MARLNLGTASRDELVDLIRRQAAKLKELQNSTALLNERDARIASMEQTVQLCKQELAEARASHSADQQAMQEQLQILSQQLVASEDTIATLLKAQDEAATNGGGAGDGARAAEADTALRKQQEEEQQIASALDAVLMLRVQRLEEQLSSGSADTGGSRRGAVDPASSDSRPAANTGAEASPVAAWARNTELASLRQQLSLSQDEAAEKDTEVRRLREENANLWARVQQVGRELAAFEWRALTSHIVDVDGTSTPSRQLDDDGVGESPGVASALSPEGIVLPPLGGGGGAPVAGAAGGLDLAGALTGRHRASSTSRGRAQGRASTSDVTSVHAVARRFDVGSTTSSTTTSTDASDDDESDGGGGWGNPAPVAAVARFGADGPRQGARVVGAGTLTPSESAAAAGSGAGSAGGRFSGGGTMSRLRHRVAELEAELLASTTDYKRRLRDVHEACSHTSVELESERHRTSELEQQVAAAEAKCEALLREHEQERLVHEQVLQELREEVKAAVATATADAAKAATAAAAAAIADAAAAATLHTADQVDVTADVLHSQLKRIGALLHATGVEVVAPSLSPCPAVSAAVAQTSSALLQEDRDGDFDTI